ncbi:MAG: polyprenyl synthetase family protein [Bdellovibrionaceae bacterium]|nr:polyprenyl synthetase family protein [Pseudobdellovibrionaceae bacterium]MDW8189378.1 polyprenyl synthetase family protein [Pseudobdellovibrionaceae bacterium]
MVPPSLNPLLLPKIVVPLPMDEAKQLISLFEQYSQRYFTNTKTKVHESSIFKRNSNVFEAMEYSFFSGGKRFRPLLGLSLTQVYRDTFADVLPWLLGIEMIHTYSLIHDDLPPLDNDDLRRNKPTCHKVFGEDIAILAGDALSTWAFQVIAQEYQNTPTLALQLVNHLSEAIGVSGMVHGQMIDLHSKRTPLSLEETLEMHRLKTGALIKVTLWGVAAILGLTEEQQRHCALLGEKIGLAFQLRDDLIDSNLEIERGSIPAIVGLERTRQILSDIHSESQLMCEALGIKKHTLFYKLLQFNIDRQH